MTPPILESPRRLAIAAVPRIVHTVKPRPELYAAATGAMYFGVPTVWSRIAAGESQAGLADRLIEFVAGALSHHKRPRAVVFLDELPRNAMGKVQKKLLSG